MPPSPNQNSYFAALQQRSRLPDTGQVWRWIGRDESGLAIIQSQRGDIVRAWLAGNAAIGDGEPVLYIPPGPGEVLGQVQLATVLPVPEVRIFDESVEPGLPIRGVFFEFEDNFTGNIFIGLDRPEPELAISLDFDAETVFRTNLKSTGPGLNDWVLSLAIGPAGSGVVTKIVFVRPSAAPVTVPSPGSDWESFPFGTWAAWQRRNETEAPGRREKTLDVEHYNASGQRVATATGSSVQTSDSLTGAVSLTLTDVIWATPSSAMLMSVSAASAFFPDPISWNPFWLSDSQSVLRKGNLVGIESGPPSSRIFSPESIANGVGYDVPLASLAPLGNNEIFVGDSLYSPDFFPSGSDPGEIKSANVFRRQFLPDGSTTDSEFEAEYYDIDGSRLDLVFGSLNYYPPD